MGKIYAAKTNHITNPLGFYLKPLVFSWKVKGGRGQEQKHARIVISKNKTFTDICHDTGGQSWTVSLQEWNLNRSRIQDITGKLL